VIEKHNFYNLFLFKITTSNKKILNRQEGGEMKEEREKGSSDTLNNLIMTSSVSLEKP